MVCEWGSSAVTWVWPLNYRKKYPRAVSSVGSERLVYTQEVTGSNPVPPIDKRGPDWRGYSSQRTLHRGIVNHRLDETRDLMREALQVTTWIRRFIRWRLKFRRRFLGDRAADRILSFWGKIFGQRFVDWIKDIESSGDKT